MPDGRDVRPAGGLRYGLDGVAPQIHPDAWIAPNAVLIGDVRIAAGASIWFGCVLRGDTNPIIVGARSNIQDGTVIHVDHGRHGAIIGAEVTIGHAAIIHACTLRDRAFIAWGRPCWMARSWRKPGCWRPGVCSRPAKRSAAWNYGWARRRNSPG